MGTDGLPRTVKERKIKKCQTSQEQREIAMLGQKRNLSCLSRTLTRMYCAFPALKILPVKLVCSEAGLHLP